MDKSLADKAIQFKGKDYVEVKERVIYFNETYPNGCIQTLKLESNDRVEFKAIVIPDSDKPLRFFTGHSQASFADTTSFVNKTSAMENAETSAVGRALAFMSIGVIDSVASLDEINKANNSRTSSYTTQTIKTPIKTKSDQLDHNQLPFDGEEVCSKCNAPMATSKTKGTKYCSKLCWKN